MQSIVSHWTRDLIDVRKIDDDSRRLKENLKWLTYSPQSALTAPALFPEDGGVETLIMDSTGCGAACCGGLARLAAPLDFHPGEGKRTAAGAYRNGAHLACVD